MFDESGGWYYLPGSSFAMDGESAAYRDVFIAFPGKQYHPPDSRTKSSVYQ